VVGAVVCAITYKPGTDVPFGATVVLIGIFFGVIGASVGLAASVVVILLRRLQNR
jgi:hypothetical protein